MQENVIKCQGLFCPCSVYSSICRRLPLLSEGKQSANHKPKPASQISIQISQSYFRLKGGRFSSMRHNKLSLWHDKKRKKTVEAPVTYHNKILWTHPVNRVKYDLVVFKEHVYQPKAQRMKSFQLLWSRYLLTSAVDTKHCFIYFHLFGSRGFNWKIELNQ